jgi:hypothetical protein
LFRSFLHLFVLFRSNQHVKSKGNTKKKNKQKGKHLIQTRSHTLLLLLFHYFWLGACQLTDKNIMTTGINDLLDPFVCSCFPTSYHQMMCKKVKWSTISISTAMVIIVSKCNLHTQLFYFRSIRSSMQVVDCTLWLM